MKPFTAVNVKHLHLQAMEYQLTMKTLNAHHLVGGCLLSLILNIVGL